MKFIISIILAISFISLTTFGASFLNHTSNHSNPNCFASVLMGGIDCPESLLSFVIHHISAIQGLSNILLSLGVELSLLIFLTLFSVFIFSVFRYLKRTDKILSISIRLSRLKLSLSKQRISSWLSLFEHSPSF